MQVSERRRGVRLHEPGDTMIASSVIRASVGGVSHIAPGMAAWAMDAIYSRPADHPPL